MVGGLLVLGQALGGRGRRPVRVGAPGGLAVAGHRDQGSRIEGGRLGLRRGFGSEEVWVSEEGQYRELKFFGWREGFFTPSVVKEA